MLRGTRSQSNPTNLEIIQGAMATPQLTIPVIIQRMLTPDLRGILCKLVQIHRHDSLARVTLLGAYDPQMWFTSSNDCLDCFDMGRRMDSFFDLFKDIFEWPRLDEEDLTWSIVAYSRDVFLRLSSHEASTCAHQPARGLALSLLLFLAFTTGEGAYSSAKDYSLPRYSHVFPSTTRGKSGLIGYNICNRRVCMGTRVSRTTKHVHTIRGSVPERTM